MERSTTNCYFTCFDLRTNIVLFYVLLHETTAYLPYAYVDTEHCGSSSSVFKSFPNVSLERCIQECKTRPKCEALNHRRLYDNHCQLLDSTDVVQKDSDDCLYLKRANVDTSDMIGISCNCVIGETCNMDAGACYITECDPIRTTEHGRIIGNKYDIGSSLRIACNQGYREQNNVTITTCLATGQWDVMPVCTLIAPVCDEDWVQYNDNCYYMSSNNKAFQDAKAECVTRGGYLVRPETQEENEVIRNSGLSSALNYWIGVELSSTNKWVWTDTAEEIDFTDWGRNQPFDKANDEPCVMLYGDDSHRWHDAACNGKRNYICEKSTTL